MMAQRPIDNLRLLLAGEAGQWIPFSLDVGAMSGFSPPIERTFRRITGADDPAAYFDADVRRFSLPVRFGGDDPARLHEPVEPGTTFDEWGIGHRAADVEGTVDRTYAPLARARSVKDVDALPSPVIETDADASPVEAYHAAGYPVFGYAGSIYEWSWWIRGMEHFLVDLVSDPPMAEALIRKVERHTTRLAVATARAGVDVLSFYDDAGMQRGMQLSPHLWRQHVKPAWRRVIEAVRAESPTVKLFLHSCGKIDEIVPDIVELGFDVLHPVQPECMDFDATYRRFGHQILLTASISSQKVLPFGSADDVRREVKRLSEIVARDRRCLVMPSNVIQPETPWENVVALAEEARALREHASSG
jgi:uroporphyrinogen decarboxylase